MLHVDVSHTEFDVAEYSAVVHKSAVSIDSIILLCSLGFQCTNVLFFETLEIMYEVEMSEPVHPDLFNVTT